MNSARGVVRHPKAEDAFHPRFVVWELTLACDQRCLHCGSRAADARANELNTDDALRVVGEMAGLGTREVSLIGGEAYLHPGFLTIVEAIVAAGMRCSLTTGGRGITRALAVALKAAGLHSASVSIDGLGRSHDLMRATVGSFDSATQAVQHFVAAKIPVGCNTVVTRANAPELEALFERLAELGMRGWQVQLMAALGRAADRPDLLVQPWELLELVPRLARLKERAYERGILLTVGNNVGYFSQDERLLRSLVRDGRSHWQGCQAGRYSMGIESDGAVKGCPSLQTDTYVGGNVRDRSLRQIWESTPQLAFARDRSVDQLWGFCAECPFGSVCHAGCTFTAHGLMGRPGNNPYCHFRAKTFAERGLRERLVPVAAAPGKPFDSGRFEIMVEPFTASDPKPDRIETLFKVRRPTSNP